MKVCFIGVGSIAKRHIRNLRTVCGERCIDVTIDAYRRNPERPDGVDSVYTKVSDMPNDYDVVFITNPTEFHLDSLKLFQKKGSAFFIEKPLVSSTQINDAKNYNTDLGKIYYVASPLRYNPVIMWIKNHISPSEVLSVRCISSSYLPEWRTGQDYRMSYSAHRSMGGGVSTDLIHEWDYITYIFGWPYEIKCMMGKNSDLEIDCEDYAIYLAKYDRMTVEIHLDYFGRNTIREIQLITKNGTIVGDLNKNTIYSLGNGSIMDFHEERDDFQKRELHHFIDIIEGKCLIEDGFSNGLNVLELTQGSIGR